MNSGGSNVPGLRDGTFGGLNIPAEEAEVVLVPVPWDVTVSFRDGTRNGPQAILEASPQLEFRNQVSGLEWTSIAMLPIPEQLAVSGVVLRKRAREVISWLEQGSPASEAPRMSALQDSINTACAEMVSSVTASCEPWIERNRIAAVVGGDHSTSLGLYRALAARHGPLGLLHLDAHRDLRRAYEGFTFSHASIMRNACEEGLLEKLVQVGTRDYCPEEQEYARAAGAQIRSYDSRFLARQDARGITWTETVREILAELPEKVVVSFDIDVLEPAMCPNTGTPVPGGLAYEKCFYLLEELVTSGRRIIGFDVTEVAPDPDGRGIDAIVGAQVVYRLATLAAATILSQS